MQYPSSWTSDAKFMYSNKVAFGQTCDQHFINIEGQSQVSEEQKRYSQISEESILCQSHSVSEEKYRLELSNCRDSERRGSSSLRRSTLRLSRRSSSLVKRRGCSLFLLTRLSSLSPTASPSPSRSLRPLRSLTP